MKSPELEQLRRDMALAKTMKELSTMHEEFLKRVGSVQGLAEEVRAQMKRISALPKGDRGERGPIGPQGIPGKAGKDGKNGVDGVTPVKGKDYLTKDDKEELTIGVLSRIRTPKDGEDAAVDTDKIKQEVLEKLKDEELIGVDNVKGLRNELSSYRNQLARKQAGQHGGGDTVVAGTGVTITPLANGTKEISATGSGTGTVTDVSVVSANGLAGSVATSTTTPAITLSTTVTGVLKGNGTAISAAVANTDYQSPIALTTTGTSGAATFNGTTLNIPNYATGGGTVDSVVAGTGITVDATDPANPIVATTITQYTDELAQDAVGTILVNSTEIDFDYNDATPSITASLIAGSIDETKLDASVNASLDLADSAVQENDSPSFGTVTATVEVVSPELRASSSAGVLIEANNGTDVSLFGVGNTANVTHYGVHQFPTGGVQIGSSVPFADTAGTLTLQNVDVLDATTESTIEAAIDTLANLTSIQGRTVTLADAGADAIFGWDDSANAYQNLSATDARTALGLATTDSPQFANIELGNASDTTVSRSAAGVIAVEGVVIPSISSTNTLTNKRITKRVGSTTSSATPTINTDDVDAYHLTAQTADITSFTTNLSGTPTNFQQLRISVTGTAARAITWGSSFANGPVALPTTTVTTTRLDVLFEYDTVTSKWRCMASGSTV